MKPTVGRIVHFYPPQAEVLMAGATLFYAALVVAVHDAHGPSVDLVTFGPGSIYFQFGVSERGQEKPGESFWAWPPMAGGGK